MSSTKKRRDLAKAKSQIETEKLRAGAASGETVIWKAGAILLQRRCDSLILALRDARRIIQENYDILLVKEPSLDEVLSGFDRALSADDTPSQANRNLTDYDMPILR